MGWTPLSLVSFQAELEKLKHATFTPSGARLHAIPGFVRFEGSLSHPEMNTVPSKFTTNGWEDSLFLDKVIGNDLFFRLCVPPRLQAHLLSDGSATYFEMCNPHQAMWILPREMLKPKLQALDWGVYGRPRLPEGKRPQEWYGSGWLFRCPRQRKLHQYCIPTHGARKLTPCERVCDFLVPHYGGGKYSYGSASEW